MIYFCWFYYITFPPIGNRLYTIGLPGISLEISYTCFIYYRSLFTILSMAWLIHIDTRILYFYFANVCLYYFITFPPIESFCLQNTSLNILNFCHLLMVSVYYFIYGLANIYRFCIDCSRIPSSNSQIFTIQYTFLVSRVSSGITFIPVHRYTCIPFTYQCTGIPLKKMKDFAV